MSIYAIADLHLSLSPNVDKPMDIYGGRWYKHTERLKINWCSTVKEKDTVIIPGDISWALKLEDAKYDLDFLSSLPGHKVLLKGNHDLWWSGIRRLNSMYDDMTFIQNDCYKAEGIYICGSRGWLTPDNDDYGEGDEKIYRRELMRLENSLRKARECIEQNETENAVRGKANKEIIGVLHYPPVSRTTSFSAFQQLFEDYGVKRVIYGHIHGDEGFRKAIKGNYYGVDYNLVSLDYLNCKPLLIKNQR